MVVVAGILIKYSPYTQKLLIFHKFNELQTFALRKLQVKNLTPKIEKSYPKSY